MKISYNWLKQFIKTDWTSEQTSELLTDLGLEVEVVEKYQSIKGGLEGVVVGHVLTCEKHPDADRLNITTVNIGLEAPHTTCIGVPVPTSTVVTFSLSASGCCSQVNTCPTTTPSNPPFID